MNAIEIIKQKRKELGITQDELSKKIGLSETAINKTEMGTRQLKLEDFLKIIKELNIPITKFSEEELIVISKSDLDKLKKATQLINQVADNINNQNLIINDNHGTVNITNQSLPKNKK